MKRLILAGIILLGVISSLPLFFFAGDASDLSLPSCSTTATPSVIPATQVEKRLPLPSEWEDSNADQRRRNAEEIIRVAEEVGAGEQGALIGLMVAMVESGLISDLDESESDRDSAGAFQQRAPWGPLAARTNITQSAQMFYTGGRGGQPGLLDTDGWETMPPGVAAQAVQVSAFPDRYAERQPIAQAILDAVDPLGVPTATKEVCEEPEEEEPVTPVGRFPSTCKGRSLGEYPNGKLPESALCPLVGSTALLRADAAAAFNAMSQAYKNETGDFICVTGGYRTYAVQVSLYAQKPGLAAKPGTSNHGWAKAADLCGGINTFGTTAHEWMRANAPRFDWVHPEWAQITGSRPEAWHWEYEP